MVTRGEVVGADCTAHEVAARRLLDAAASRVPCAPVRDLFPHGDLEDGYLVQQSVIALSPSRRRVGRKIGLTSRSVQAQMGVDQPDFGVLFADMAHGDRAEIPLDGLLQPRVEVEVAFVLGADLDEAPVTAVDVIRATEFVVTAIEVVDSRIRDWDISILDTVADNASSGCFVLGAMPRRLDQLDDLGSAAMRLTAGPSELSTGIGAACLGHPVNAVVWLANAVARRGAPLRTGECVLSGALGPLVPVRGGVEYVASIDGLGAVRAQFV